MKRDRAPIRTDSPPTPPQVALLLRMLEDAFSGPAWHGPHLRGTLRRVDARRAAWRPAPRRRSIAEIAVHCAYWKYAARRRLLGEKRGSFPLEGSNWFELAGPPSDSAWKAHLRLLDEMHAALRDAVAALSDRDLRRVPSGARVDNAKLLAGVAMHDVYHAGQIQLLKRLAPSEGR